MATITIPFTPATPAAPEYVVKYREVGTTVYTTLSPNPTGSPAVITGLPEGKSWEGTIQAACSEKTLSPTVNWSVTQAPQDTNMGVVVIMETEATADAVDYYVRATRNPQVELNGNITLSGAYTVVPSGGGTPVSSGYGVNLAGAEVTDRVFVGTYPTGSSGTIDSRTASPTTIQGTDGVTYNVQVS